MRNRLSQRLERVERAARVARPVSVDLFRRIEELEEQYRAGVSDGISPEMQEVCRRMAQRYGAQQGPS